MDFAPKGGHRDRRFHHGAQHHGQSRTERVMGCRDIFKVHPVADLFPMIL
jgi:hypothetical protein